MTKEELQQKLVEKGYPIHIDGAIGKLTRASLLACFTDGPDTALTEADVAEAAESLGIERAKIWTVWDVEAAAKPFMEGRPTILFEPHRFSRATAHKYDASHPHLSSRSWNRKLYPKSQTGRWNQMLEAVSLDPDAGLASASYGGFQILGENYKVCGYNNEFDFVYAQSQDEKHQLLAFVGFVTGNGLKKALQKGDWAAFAKGYNGSAYRENKYDQKLAAAYAKRSR